MGTWGTKPWENDEAGDWYADLMRQTGLASKVATALKTELEPGDFEPIEIIRAAAAMLVLLGHVYIWPAADLKQHLALAVKRLEEIQAQDWLEEMGPEETITEFRNHLAAEIEVLKLRRKRMMKRGGSSKTAAQADPRWWHF